MSDGIVIVGAGQAGYSAARKMRELDADIPIMIVGDEQVLPYQRPPLSKKYLSGEMPIERLMFAEQSWYDNENISVRCGVSVQSLDRDQAQISLSDGSSLRYTKLLLATGSTPRTLPEAIGGQLKGVHYLRSSADSDGMRSYLQDGKSLVVIGGGYIGLEVAAVAASSGMSVTIVEMADRILQRVAAPETSDYFRNLHQSHGVTVCEATSLEQIVGEDGCVTAVKLSDGTQIETDFVLAGIGVLPNDAIARECGLDVGNGIQTNEYCQTSDPNIYAAGDCCSFEFRGEETRLESVPNAMHQAEVAAENMIMGNAKSYVATPWFWSDQYNVKLQIAGLNRGYDKTVVRAGKREGSQSVWYYQNDELIAVDAMNEPACCMIARRVLESGRSIPIEVAADPDANLKDYS